MADCLTEYILDGGYRRVIWDWNGTLLDDLGHHSQAMDKVCRHFGKPPLEEEHYRSIFGFPVTGFYERLGFDLLAPTFQELSEVFFRHYGEGLDTICLFDGVEDTLAAASNAGVRQAILSAHHEDPLRQLVARHGIASHFDHVFGLDHTEAHSKEERGTELMAVLKEDPATILMIGDTDHDYEVGQALGVDVLLVADGLQTEERLRAVCENVLPSRYA